MRPTVTFVIYLYALEIEQRFRMLGIPVIVVLPTCGRERAHNNLRAPLPKKRWMLIV